MDSNLPFSYEQQAPLIFEACIYQPTILSYSFLLDSQHREDDLNYLGNVQSSNSNTTLYTTLCCMIQR